MSERNVAISYFDRIAYDFEAIYTGERPTLWRWMDRVFRKAIFERERIALQSCDDLSGKRVLDLGCGSGRFAVSAAEQGAALVVGIDGAASMLAMARKRAQAAGVAERCSFIQMDFLLQPLEGGFDIVVALGVFDYIKEHMKLLVSIARASEDLAVASFPMKWSYRTPLRRIRLGLRGVPVYFYTRSQLDAAFVEVGFSDRRIVRLGPSYLVIAHKSGKDLANKETWE